MSDISAGADQSPENISDGSNEVELVLSSCLEYSSFGVRQGIARGGRSGSDGLFGDLIPYLESDGQFGAVVGGSHPVPGWAEVRRDPAEHCEESLC